MKSNLFARLLQRGSGLFRASRQRQPRLSSLPRLEMLEERQLLSVSFGGFHYFSQFAPVTVEIVIQQAALSQSSTVFALGQTGSQSMFSFFGQGSQAAPMSDMNANPSNLVTSSAAAADESMSRGSPQPVETTTPVVERVTVLPVLSFPFINPQVNLQPGVALINTPATPAVNTTAANAPRPSASISLYSAGTSLDPWAVANPDSLPSSENPAAPANSNPAVPPALPEPAPTMPVIPPGGAASVSPTKGDVDTHVFAQFASFVDHAPVLNLPAEMFAMPARAQHNATPLQSPVNETTALVGAPDALLAQVTLGTAPEATDVARERLTPAGDRWTQFVAPLFVMAGTYFRGQASRRTKLRERSRPAQLPKR